MTPVKPTKKASARLSSKLELSTNKEHLQRHSFRTEQKSKKHANRSVIRDAFDIDEDEEEELDESQFLSV